MQVSPRCATVPRTSRKGIFLVSYTGTDGPGTIRITTRRATWLRWALVRPYTAFLMTPKDKEVAGHISTRSSCAQGCARSHRHASSWPDASCRWMESASEHGENARHTALALADETSTRTPAGRSTDRARSVLHGGQMSSSPANGLIRTVFSAVGCDGKLLPLSPPSISDDVGEPAINPREVTSGM